MKIFKIDFIPIFNPTKREKNIRVFAIIFFSLDSFIDSSWVHVIIFLLLFVFVSIRIARRPQFTHHSQTSKRELFHWKRAKNKKKKIEKKMKIPQKYFHLPFRNCYNRSTSCALSHRTINTSFDSIRWRWTFDSSFFFLFLLRCSLISFVFIS